MSAAPSEPSMPQEINVGSEAYHSIAATAEDQNVIVSPLLLEATLALLYLGSDGATAEELQGLLKLKQRFASNAKMANYYANELSAATGDADTRIQLQSRLLIQGDGKAGASIAEDFQKIAQTYFHATAECQDLQQQEKLRQYICEHILPSVGGGKWQQLELPQLSNQTSQLLLLLAAQLHSKWFLPFSAYRTGLYEFHGQDAAAAAPKAVPMLFDDDMFVKYAELRELDARAIELPYEHVDELAMLLILPNQRDANALRQLEAQLRQVDLAALQQGMKMESVQVLVPKFSIDFECSLRQAIQGLGLEHIFNSSANFKHLYPGSSLPIVDILQKLRIELNETGSSSATSAAPATTAYKPIVISNSRQKFFRADHPFFFAIRGEQSTIFLGHVVSC